MASSSTFQYVSEPVSALQCVICLEVAEDPWQHGKCGKLLCKECIEIYGKDKVCPNCRGHPQYFEDSRSKEMHGGLAYRTAEVRGPGFTVVWGAWLTGQQK